MGSLALRGIAIRGVMLSSSSIMRGIPGQITVDGVVYLRLKSSDGQWLKGSSGAPLYGRKA